LAGFDAGGEHTYHAVANATLGQGYPDLGDAWHQESRDVGEELGPALGLLLDVQLLNYTGDGATDDYTIDSVGAAITDYSAPAAEALRTYVAGDDLEDAVDIVEACDGEHEHHFRAKRWSALADIAHDNLQYVDDA
jgi:hypothetical protein